MCCIGVHNRVCLATCSLALMPCVPALPTNVWAHPANVMPPPCAQTLGQLVEDIHAYSVRNHFDLVYWTKSRMVGTIRNKFESVVTAKRNAGMLPSAGAALRAPTSVAESQAHSARQPVVHHTAPVEAAQRTPCAEAMPQAQPAPTSAPPTRQSTGTKRSQTQGGSACISSARAAINGILHNMPAAQRARVVAGLHKNPPAA
jgi:hypothetical protein